MTHRAESNVSRTLSKLAALGVVAMEPGEGRAKVPRLLVRSLRCELDLATGSVRLIDAVRVSAQASAKPARARRAAAPAGSRCRTVAT